MLPQKLCITINIFERNYKKVLSIIVCLFLGVTMVMAQRTVKGTVTSSDDGEPIIGATVIVPGTKTGTVTTADGSFSLYVPEGAKTIRFSFIGMVSLELPIKNQMNVVLTPDTQVLEDVVITAQGLSRKEKSIGYAAQKVDGEKLQMSRVTDLSNGKDDRWSRVWWNVADNESPIAK